jgi:hypothetical protein
MKIASKLLVVAFGCLVLWMTDKASAQSGANVGGGANQVEGTGRGAGGPGDGEGPGQGAGQGLGPSQKNTATKTKTESTSKTGKIGGGANTGGGANQVEGTGRGAGGPGDGEGPGQGLGPGGKKDQDPASAKSEKEKADKAKSEKEKSEREKIEKEKPPKEPKRNDNEKPERPERNEKPFSDKDERPKSNGGDDGKPENGRPTEPERAPKEKRGPEKSDNQQPTDTLKRDEVKPQDERPAREETNPKRDEPDKPVSNSEDKPPGQDKPADTKKEDKPGDNTPSRTNEQGANKPKDKSKKIDQSDVTPKNERLLVPESPVDKIKPSTDNIPGVGRLDTSSITNLNDPSSVAGGLFGKLFGGKKRAKALDETPRSFSSGKEVIAAEKPLRAPRSRGAFLGLFKLEFPNLAKATKVERVVVDPRVTSPRTVTYKSRASRVARWIAPLTFGLSSYIPFETMNAAVAGRVNNLMAEEEIEVERIISKVFAEQLQDSKRYKIANPPDAVFELELTRYALDPMPTSLGRMKPTVSVTGRLYDANSQLLWLGKGFSTFAERGIKGATVEQYEEDPDLLRRDFEAAANSAIRRLAMQANAVPRATVTVQPVKKKN